MSAAANNILKTLSDLSTASDKIADEFKLPPLSQWICAVKAKADSIAFGESPTKRESGEIPTLMSYIGETSRGPRVSTVLTEIQRQHLHKSAKVSIKARNSRKSSIRIPSLRRSSVKIPPTVKKTGNVNSSTPSSERKEAASVLQPLATFTPVVNGKGTSLKERSSKRKSSSEVKVLYIKKAKVINYSEETENSAENPKVETKQMKAKNSSLLPNYANIKSSVGAANVSVLKENRILQTTKLGTKQDTASKNLKNIMALRQQKLEQNKKTRDEKFEKTQQQRLRLEKEKQELREIRLRSGRKEKVVTPKKPMQKKVVAGSEILDKNSMKSDETSVKKLKVDQHIPFKTKGTSGKNHEKTPAKKNQKEGTEKRELNSTFAIGEPSTSGYKGKTLKEGTMKDLPKTQTLKKHLTPSQKKGPESYAITPARSSFVSYDISEIRSDSEDEDQETNSKPIPSWATGVRLRNALLQQHHHPIDTDELFGNDIPNPDLTSIMGVSKKQYNKRTSSAIWNSAFA